ncbi:MAG: hypothetical protein MR629_04820 [Helicobacter sp.]|nr:hypothetical protein [Helicobacter sp.]MDD7567014.1 hypothetical protein [Helicobacter sp.]MDY5741215.1 hypothetical protein [Helicobacter sp.]
MKPHKIIDPDSVDESVDNPSKNILRTDFIVFLAVLACFETHVLQRWCCNN